MSIKPQTKKHKSHCWHQVYLLKPHSGIQVPYAQNSNISADLEIDNTTSIEIQIVGCRSMVADLYPALLYIGMLPTSTHHYKFTPIPI